MRQPCQPALVAGTEWPMAALWQANFGCLPAKPQRWGQLAHPGRDRVEGHQQAAPALLVLAVLRAAQQAQRAQHVRRAGWGMARAFAPAEPKPARLRCRAPRLVSQGARLTVWLARIGRQRSAAQQQGAPAHSVTWAVSAATNRFFQPMRNHALHSAGAVQSQVLPSTTAAPPVHGAMPCSNVPRHAML